MTYFKKQWLLPLLIIIIVLGTGVIFVQSLFSKEEQMTKEEIEQQLASMYEGAVGELIFEDGIYATEIIREGGVYSIEVNAMNGQVLAMTLVEKIEEVPKLLSEQEVRDLIVEKYQNEIEGITFNEEKETPSYDVEIAKDETRLKIIVNAKTGEIIEEEEQPSAPVNIVNAQEKEQSSSQTKQPSTSTNTSKTQQKQGSSTSTTAPKTVEKKQPPAPTTTLITQAQAIKIALGQLAGEVEDVDFVKQADGGYYLVEIEQDRDDDDLEAVFQIHAITGKVMSVKWED